MKIDLTHFQAFKLSEEFARLVMHRVTEQRLALVGVIGFEDDLEFSEMQGAIRSISDGYDRISFVSNLRYHFQELRRKRGEHIRGRDYVAAVRAYERSRQLLEAAS